MEKEQKKKKHKLKAPNSYVILMMIIAVMAILSWIIPGGAYDYVDPNADKLEPIAGTYHSIESLNRIQSARFMGCYHGSYKRLYGFC